MIITEEADNTFLEYSDRNNPMQIFSEHLIAYAKHNNLEIDEGTWERIAEMNEYMIEKVEVVEEIYFDGKPIFPGE